MRQTYQWPETLESGQKNRIAIVGIGQELWGDDGAGVAVVRRLKDLLSRDCENLLLLEAGNAPENVLGAIIRHQPDVVYFVDVAEMGVKPGTIALLDGQSAEGLGGSTHTLSLAMLAGYIENETGTSPMVIGIQPESYSFGSGLSAVVSTAVENIAGTLANHWRSAVAAASAKTAGGVSDVST